MVFSDFLQSVFLFDSSLHKTLIGLLLKPGKTVQSESRVNPERRYPAQTYPRRTGRRRHRQRPGVSARRNAARVLPAQWLG